MKWPDVGYILKAEGGANRAKAGRVSGVGKGGAKMTLSLRPK